MVDEEVISLQIGNYSNYVGAHLWNIRDNLEGEPNLYYHSDNNFNLTPRCVMVDMFENIGSYPGEGVQQEVEVDSSIWSGSITKSVLNEGESFGESWTDLASCDIHSKSLVQLPKWVSSKSFDSYYNGKNSNLISEDVIEDISDRLRYFAEGCNRVSAIQCMVDMHQGFGGLSSILLERIRDDFGTSIALPVFAFGESSTRHNYSMKSNLKALDIPLCYTSLLEYANVVIPIDKKQSILDLFSSVTEEQSSLVSALTLQAVTLFDMKTSSTGDNSINNIRDWIKEITQSNRFPVCTLETSFHHVNAPFNIDQLVTRVNGVEGSMSNLLNPFLSSISLVNYYNGVNYNTRSQLDGKNGYVMPYTNVVTSLGNYPSDWLNIVSSRTSNYSQYRVSNSRHASSSSLYVTTAQFNSLFGSLDRNEESIVSVITGVGASQAVGHHLHQVLASWIEDSSASRVQLQKLGVVEEDINEINEQLLDCSSTYL